MRRLSVLLLPILLVITSCGDDADAGPLTVYSGRSEELVAPLIATFETETGIDVEVRYASSTDLAATIREEGSNSPADVFWAQDPGSLGAVARAELFRELPESLLALVPSRFSDSDGLWVGTSGRSRVVVYDSTRIAPEDLPDSIDGFTDPVWRGRIGIAPTNASFIAFVGAMILERGEEATEEWLNGIAANEPQIFSGNAPIVAAIDDGTLEVGLVNHYYLLGLVADSGPSDARNYFFSTAGPGSLIMPAGAGILVTSDHPDVETFIEFLLAEESQRYFVEETYEYPVLPGISADESLPAIDTLAQPDIDLSELAVVLDRATDLITVAGLL